MGENAFPSVGVRIVTCTFALFPYPAACRVCNLLVNQEILTTAHLLAVDASSKTAFFDHFAVAVSTIQAAYVPFARPTLEALYHVRCRLRFNADGGVTLYRNPRPRHCSVTRRAARELRPSHTHRRTPLTGVRRVSTLRRLSVAGRSSRTCAGAPRADTRAARSWRSVFLRQQTPRRAATRPAVATRPRRTTTVRVRPSPSIQYIPRREYLAGVRPPLPRAGFVLGDLERPPTAEICFSGAVPCATDIWQAALLFRLCPGFFQYGEDSNISYELLEIVFRSAIEKSCATLKTQRKVAGFVSAYVASAVSDRIPFYGRSAVFAISRFLQSLNQRGRSVPGLARWALKVVGGILCLELPLGHPAVVAVVGKAKRTGIPEKHAPMLELPFIIWVETIACNGSVPFGMRYVASAFFLMIMASLRFSDTKVVFDLWVTETAICGRSRGLKRKGRPISNWAAPLAGIHSKGAWVSPVMKVWNASPPVEKGHRAIFLKMDTDWNVDHSKFAPYYLVLRLLRPIATAKGFDAKWTLHSARNWLPTCANQLGWTQEDRRKLGHWAANSEMMDRYDRALCTTELRLRNGIVSRISAEGWAPTASFEVPEEPKLTTGVTPMKGEPTPTPDDTPQDGGPTPAPEVVPVKGVAPPGESDSETSVGTAPSDHIDDIEEVDISDLFGPDAFA